MNRFPNRAVIRLEGPDTLSVLERTVTHTVGTGWREGEMRFGALLTPQGKIIADWLATRTADGVWLDVHEDAAEDLEKRLKLFRLRAKMDITRDETLAVVTAKDGDDDPRSLKLWWRQIIPASDAGNPIDPARWTAHRIEAGVPEWGSDYRAAEVFPSDVNMDHMGGVDYKKGCFVGQEVVSRMKRRAIARRRTLSLSFPDIAPEPGTPVLAADHSIGEITSSAGKLALARLRVDRLHAAESEGATITSGGLPVSVEKPDWLAAEIAAMSGDA